MKTKWMALPVALLIVFVCSIVKADPIQENFGPRPSPWPGFLALEQIPLGFKEKMHFFSRHQYEISLTKATEAGEAVLQILESDITIFVEPKDRPATKQFTFRGQPGRVFCHAKVQNTGYASCTLYWYNSPMQRLSLYLEDPTLDERSSDYLIEILESMKPVLDRA
jgi:hypothetical protein